MKFYKPYLIFAVSLILIISNVLHAQYIIEQLEEEIPINYELIPEDMEFDSFKDEAEYILTIDNKKLIDAAKSSGMEVVQEKSTLYIDGDNFAAEMSSDEMGKVSVVSDAKSGRMYTINWNQKTVIEIDASELGEIEERSKAFANEMLDNLPEEYRKQVMVEMENEMNMDSPAFEINPTGKKATLYGFKCDGYVGIQEEESIYIWAAKDNIGIVKDIEKISKKFEQLFNSDDEDRGVDEWGLIPGKIPIQIKRMSYSGMYGDPIIDISSITNIKKQNPPKEKFYVPDEKDGFERGTMMDLMDGILNQ